MFYSSSFIFALVFFLYICISIGDVADSDTIPATDILQAEKDASSGTLKPSSERNYPALKVLGFVTPWNSAGVPMAKLAAEHGRLDSVSPVTYNVRDGQVHGDEDFLRRMKESANGAELHPRFNFEDAKWTTDIEQMAKNIVDACEEIGAKGAVLEVWHAAAGEIAYLRLLGGFIKRDSGTLKVALVVPPLTKRMTRSSMKSLGEFYDTFVVMAYDYTTPNEEHGEPGPLAPVEWVRAVAEYWSKDSKLGKKVLLGLNFYGLDFAQRKGTEENEREQEGGKDRHITGDKVMKLLAEHKPELRWFKKDTVAEHVFEYNDDSFERLVFYPTAKSIQKRLDIAEDTGCGGVAVWELGQGLVHFLNEF